MFSIKGYWGDTFVLLGLLRNSQLILLWALH
jgi:hypothetical protein